MSDELFQDELDEIDALPDTVTRPGYVYVIHAESTNRIKIGHTRNVQTRLADLQTYCPFPVRLLYAVYCDDAPALESLLHGAMGQYRVLGEWFAMPDDAATCLSLLGLLATRIAATGNCAPTAERDIAQVWEDRLPSLPDLVLAHLSEHQTFTMTDLAVALRCEGKRYQTLRTTVYRLWKKGLIGRRGNGTYFRLERSSDLSM